jgi:peroxiredoxin
MDPFHFIIRIPEVTFKTRVVTNQSPGFAWQDKTTVELFKNKRVVLTALPGAFTPTCSSTHLPGFEAAYDEIRQNSIDEVYCLSVNDSFTMNAWFAQLGITKVKPIPDGSGEFTRKMGFLVEKDNLGFGMRSWRYTMVITDGVVEMMWVEPGMGDNVERDPFFVSNAQNVLQYLKQVNEEKK